VGKKKLGAFRAYRKSLVISSLGALLIVIFGIAVLINTMFIHVDAQGGLVFLFLPIYQWLAILVLVFICWLLKRSGFANT
jgi:hypothetical protein